jgi:trk system potassium uptake protein TrkA
VGGGIIVRKIEVDKWSGKTLRQLDLPEKHDMLVVAIEEEGGKTVYFPKADRVLKQGDNLVVFAKSGMDEDLET